MIVDIGYEKNKNILAVSLANHLLSTTGKPVFLCVGTDKIVCDSVGAITGELLLKKYKINAYVYGTLEKNVDANNLESTIKRVKENHPNSPIILIDGILGELDEIGQVKFYPSGAIAGGEFHKGVYIGDYSILAVVNTKGIDSLNLLKCVKLNNILRFAEFIAESIAKAFRVGLNLIG